MKKLFSTAVFVWLYLVSISQPPQPVTIVKSTDEKNLEQTFIVEIRGNNGAVVKRITWKKAIDGSSKRVEEDLTPGGKITCKNRFEFDENGEILSFQYWNNQLFWRKKTGPRFAGMEEHETRYQKELKSIEENSPIIDAKKTACSQTPGGTCRPKAQLFAGYSFLNADFGNNRESFPLGAQAALLVNLARGRIALGPDISFHTKKINDQTITRMFLLARGQYNFVRKTDINDSEYSPELSSNSCPSVIPDVHVYIGYSTERSVIKIGNNKNTSSGGGFTFGAGVGVNIKLSYSIGLGIQADYLGTKFKNNDEINSDIRGSAGINLAFRRARQNKWGVGATGQF
jgi:hypothetical protein